MCGYYKRRIGISFQLTPTNESRSWLILAPYQACAEMKETSLELPPGRFPPRIVVYWAFFAMNFVHLCGKKTEKRRFGTCHKAYILSLDCSSSKLLFLTSIPCLYFQWHFSKWGFLFYFILFLFLFFANWQKISVFWVFQLSNFERI